MQVRPTIVFGGAGNQSLLDTESKFHAAGYRVTFMPDAGALRWRCESNPPDLLILDSREATFDLRELAQDFGRFAKFPILILGERAQVAQFNALGKACGLLKGAVYFLYEPFGVSELLENVKAILQRSSRREPMCRVEFPTRVVWPTSQHHSLARG